MELPGPHQSSGWRWRRNLVRLGAGAWTPAFAWLAAFDQLLDNALNPVSVGQGEAGQPDANAVGILDGLNGRFVQQGGGGGVGEACAGVPPGHRGEEVAGF